MLLGKQGIDLISLIMHNQNCREQLHANTQQKMIYNQANELFSLKISFSDGVNQFKFPVLCGSNLYSHSVSNVTLV